MKITQSDFEVNSKYYLSLIPKEKKKLVRLWPGLENKVLNAILNKKPVYNQCVVCTKLTKGPFSRYCTDKSCTAVGRGHLKGKKRPEHSACMSVVMKRKVAEGTAWGPEHRKNNLVHMKLLNATLDRSAHSKALKTLESKRKQLVNASSSALSNTKLWKRSDLTGLTPDSVLSLTDAKVKRLHRIYNSVKSIDAADRHPNMGSTLFYKRIVFSRLKNYHEAAFKTITVRSSLEAAFVQWLEGTKYTWKYEWAKVPTEWGFCKPDFKVYTKNKTWVVEVKGMFRPDLIRNLNNPFHKITSVAAFCRTKGYGYCVLTNKQIGRHGSLINMRQWTDLTLLTDRQIKKYLATYVPGAKECQSLLNI